MLLTITIIIIILVHMFAIVEKTKENSKILRLISFDSILVSVIKKRLGEEKYDILDNVSDKDLLNNQTYKPGQFLVSYGKKYVFYKKTENINIGYIYNSYNYDIIKTCTWYLIPFDDTLQWLSDSIKKEKEDKLFEYIRNKSFSNLDKIKTLINEGIDPNIKDVEGMTPLLYEIENFKPNVSVEIINFLLDSGADINLSAEYEFGRSPLLFALAYKNCEPLIEVVKLLIDKGAEINKLDDAGFSGLMILCNQYSKYTNCNEIDVVCDSTFECINLLLDNGADATLVAKNGKTAFMHLSKDLQCCEKYKNVVERLKCSTN